MDCVAPGEIREGDLMAYVEGQTSEIVEKHIARCPACAAEVKSLERATQALLTNLYRVSCPKTETLAQYQMGLLPATEHRQVAGHIRVCPHCMSELRKLARADLAVSDTAPTIFDIARTLIEAVLVTPKTEWALASRGGRHQQRLYRAGDLEVIISVELFAPSLWRVHGRVMREGRVAAEMIAQAVYLALPDRIVSTEALDEMGYFAFEDVGAGEYELWLEHLDADVVMRDLKVGVDAT